jgi:hypothetical protein
VLPGLPELLLQAPKAGRAIHGANAAPGGGAANALTELPYVWTGPAVPEGARVASLAELKDLLGSLDGVDIACFDAEGGFRLRD